MRQAGHGHGLDVARCDVGAPGQDGVGLGAAQHRDGGTGTRPEADATGGAGGTHQRHGVGGHLVDHAHVRGGGDGPLPPRRVGHRGQGVECVAAATVQHEAGLHLGVGVADRRRQAEPVELALGQGIGAHLPDGVLGADHEVRAGQGPRLAVNGHLLLLHRLEEGRLGTRRRAVHLVEQDHVGEDGPRSELPGGGVGGEDGDAGDVGREQVGVSLDARQLGAERGGQRPGEHGLAHSRHVLDQEV